MTFNAQCDSKISIEKTDFGTFSRNEFFPELLESDLVVMGVKANRFALSATCVALLAGVIIALKYSIAPSYIRFGLSQYFLFAGYSASPIMSVFSCALLSVLGLRLMEFLRSCIMKWQVIWNSNFGVHVRLNNDRSATAAFAKVFTLIIFNPAIYALIVSPAMVSGIRVVFDLPSHREFNSISFNGELQAKRVNCWNPDRRLNFTPRAISSQAASTLAEGSSTT